MSVIIEAEVTLLEYKWSLLRIGLKGLEQHYLGVGKQIWVLGMLMVNVSHIWFLVYMGWHDADRTIFGGWVADLGGRGLGLVEKKKRVLHQL